MKKLLLTLLSVSNILCYANSASETIIKPLVQTREVYTLILDGSGLNLAPDANFSDYPTWSIGVRYGFGGAWGYALPKFEGGSKTLPITDAYVRTDIEPQVGVFNQFGGAIYPSGRPISCEINPNEIKPNVTITVYLFGTVSLYKDIFERNIHPSIEDLSCRISYTQK